MSDDVQILDVAQGGLADAGHLAMSTILATDMAVREVLAHMGLSHAAQSCLFAVVLAVIVIVLMNQLRYVIQGGLLLVVSLMAVELIKPAFLAIGARLIMVH